MKNSFLPALTGRLVLLSALASGLMLVLPVGAPWGIVMVNFVLLVFFIADVIMAVKPSMIEIERELPAVLPMRSEGQITWKVRNPAPRSIHVVFDDALQPSLHALSRRVRVQVPALGQVIASTRFIPQRRGRFEISRIVVRSYGPLGLGCRQGRRDVPSVVRVYPSFKSKREAELRIEKARILEVGLRSVRGHGGGTEFEQLREYTPDDDFRRIDWAATARTLKPTVRTYRAERNQSVVCLLDCGRVMAGRVDDVSRLEHAMDAVMAVATVATRLGDRVGLLAFDHQVRAEVAVGHGSQQVAAITESMYELEAQLQESDYRGAFVRLHGRFRRRSLVIIFTELSEYAVAESLLPALGLLSKRHVVLVASVTDPDVAHWARAVPLETNKAFRKAAAVGALRKRRKTAAVLRSRGVTVVDAPPGKLAAQVADAYLHVKATGAL